MDWFRNDLTPSGFLAAWTTMGWFLGRWASHAAFQFESTLLESLPFP